MKIYVPFKMKQNYWTQINIQRKKAHKEKWLKDF